MCLSHAQCLSAKFLAFLKHWHLEKPMVERVVVTEHWRIENRPSTIFNPKKENNLKKKNERRKLEMRRRDEGGRREGAAPPPSMQILIWL